LKIPMYNSDGEMVAVAFFDGNPHDAERERFVRFNMTEFWFEAGERGWELHERAELDTMLVVPSRIVAL
jgi:hypothetical protein